MDFPLSILPRALLMPLIIAGLGNTTIGGAGSSSIDSGLRLRDEFTTNNAGPLTGPRVCEPGPGSLTLIRQGTNNGAISIASNKLTLTQPSAGHAYADCGVLLGAISRQPGIALYGIVRYSAISGLQFGFMGTNALGQFAVQGINVSIISDINSVTGLLPSLTTGEDYQLAVILRGNGARYFIKGGSQFPTWILAWVGNSDCRKILYGAVANFNSALTLDDLTLKQLGGLWLDDYGTAGGFMPLVVSGATVTTTADGLHYIVWTPVADDVLDIQVRRVDDNNCWIIRCDQADGTIKLFKKEVGAEQEFDAGKTQTWTATAGTLYGAGSSTGVPYKIAIQLYGSTIKTWVNGIAKHSETGASFQATSTGAKVTGAVCLTNWEQWPREYAGTDLDTLAPIGATVDLAVRPDRVVWISDCHFTELGGVTQCTSERGRGLAHYINALHPVVIIDTGDSGEHFGVAIGYVAYRHNMYLVLEPRPKVSRANHDENTDNNVGSVNFSVFDSVNPDLPYHWTADWPSAGIRFIGIHATYSHVVDIGQATIELDEIDWMEDEIAALPAGWKAIICCHYPANPAFGNYITAAYNGDVLRASMAANAADIAAFFNGHRHAYGMPGTLDGILHVSGGPVGQYKFHVLEHVAGTITIRMLSAIQPYGEIIPSTYPVITFAAGTP